MAWLSLLTCNLLLREYLSGNLLYQVVVFFAGVIFLIICKGVYNVWFHPAQSYPGPFLGRASRMYYMYYRMSGKLDFKTKELHDYYGQVVRIAPDELSYNGGTAWEDIYGFRSKKRPGSNLPKDPHYYIGAIAPNGEKNLGASGDADHSRIRSVLSHAFSERANYAQESILATHVDQLIVRLKETDGKPTNAVKWMHHATYDVIADLGFGHNVNALGRDGDDWDPQVRVVFDGIREGVGAVEILRFIPFKHVVLKALMWGFAGARVRNFNLSVEKAKLRMRKIDSERHDFMSYILHANETEKELTSSEISANCALLLDAGSETTGSMLSGCLFYLLKNPECLQKLTKLIRSTYSQENDMDSKLLARLPYLTAILEESMRMYMPVPAGLPRKTTAEGAIICGRYVPPGINVAVNQYSTYRSEENFAEPGAFIPERWLGDLRFTSDKRNVFQPFSTGPRNCIGKNVAYAEIRLILGRIVWNFDLELMPDSQDWHARQRSWTIWQKLDLNVKFKPAVKKA